MNLLQSRLPLALAMAALYLLLTGNVEWTNLVLAAVLGLMLSLLVTVPEHGRPLRDWPRVLWAVVLHVLAVAWDVLINGVLVATLVLWRRGRVKPGLAQLPNEHTGELAAALDAHAITLSPGQLVVSIAPDQYEVHYLQLPDDPSADESCARRRERIERFAGQRGSQTNPETRTRA